MSRNIYTDPRISSQIELPLHEHITADLQGKRNPEDEPDFLIGVIGFLVAQLNNDQADALASYIGYKKVGT